MGSFMSKNSERDDVVLLCRERKNRLKLAVERRYALADAQCKYNNSLYAIALAMRCFVASHAAPSSPFSLPGPKSSSETITPGKPTRKTTACTYSDSEVSVSPSEVGRKKQPQENLHDEEEEEKDGDDDTETDYEEAACDCSVIGVRNRDVGRAEVVRGGDCASLNQGERKDGRDLLAALKYVEDYFLKAYSFGLNVSKMLETNTVQMQSALEEIYENSNKLIRSITRSRSNASALSWPSSRRSLLRSSSRSSSTWTHFSSGLLATDSACHSVTLGKLYAWEEKLCAEVEVVEEIARTYKEKISKLRKQDTARGYGLKTRDRIRVEVNDLNAKILITTKSAESIWKGIRHLRDEELQPQLVELIHGLMKNWKIMAEYHESQKRFMSQVESLSCPSNSDQLATFKLEAEIQNWHACFASYVSSQKAYVEALEGWLSKLPTQTELYSKLDSTSTRQPCRVFNRPMSLAICHNWFVRLDNLPDKAVTCAMRSFGKRVEELKVQQGKEYQQKIKVEKLSRKLLEKENAIRKKEREIKKLKLTDNKEEQVRVRKQIEKMTEMKKKMDMLEKRRDEEKKNHLESMQETNKVAVNGFKREFSSVFDNLANFSTAAAKMYDGLIALT